jgi:hypothetical protein
MLTTDGWGHRSAAETFLRLHPRKQDRWDALHDVTNDLIRRVAEHRLKLIEGFTEKYGVARLVYFEQFDDAENAIKREKRLKKWNRA